MYDIERDPLMRDQSSEALSKRIERVISTLQRHQDAICPECAGRLCGHETLMSMVLGYQDRPMCLVCLARTVEREPKILAAEVGGYALSKDCLRTGWAWAANREAGGEACALALISEETVEKLPPAEDDDEIPAPDSEWNAGDMACGDLVLELRIRLRSLNSGKVLKVTATDPGAPEDLPAWCRMTGHAMVIARHPDYWIRKKEE